MKKVLDWFVKHDEESLKNKLNKNRELEEDFVRIADEQLKFYKESCGTSITELKNTVIRLESHLKQIGHTGIGYVLLALSIVALNALLASVRSASISTLLGWIFPIIMLVFVGYLLASEMCKSEDEKAQVFIYNYMIEKLNLEIESLEEAEDKAIDK